MADEWIKMRHRLLSEAEVKEMAVRLKVTRQHVAGCLLGVWSHADQHAIERPDPQAIGDKCPDDDGTNEGTNVPHTEGFLAFSTVDDIDHEALQAGFAQVMADVGWLRIYPDGIGFPQYEVHHSSSAKKRASEQKKKSKQRSKKQPCPPPCPEDVPTTTGQKRGPEGEGEGDRELNTEPEGGGGGGAGKSPGSPPPVRSGAGSSKAATASDVEDFLGEWDGISGVSQEHATICDESLEIDPQIRKLVEARMRDNHFAENWRRGLRFVRTSDLCRGMVPPREGFQESWRASVKQFCSPGELQKILAGKYGGNADGKSEEDDDRDLDEILQTATQRPGGVA